MKEFSIETATIGVDSGGIQTALNNLQTDVIEATKQAMESGVEEIVGYVNLAWAGASAEQFKTNLYTDKRLIAKGLDDTFENLKSEMYQIVNEVEAYDNDLVKARVE